jgi:Ca-activated chloride channel family protein
MLKGACEKNGMNSFFLVKNSGSSSILTMRILVACLLFVHLQGIAQESSSPPPYSLSVAVNEVAINFHANDFRNIPVLDLKQNELDVFDDEHGPGQIVSLQQVRDRSIDAALIFDTSGSVASQTSHSRAEAQEAVRKLLVQENDQGATVEFGRSRRVVQSWTSQKSGLLKSIAEIGVGSRDPIDGTSLYDTLFSTCLYELGKSTRVADAKAILLFSDGVDTTSHTTMQAALDRCRLSHTAIYSFTSKPVPGASSFGLSTLLQLTQQTGGRLFYSDDPDGSLSVDADMDIVESDLRNEYLLLYRPKTLIHDGAFHSIVLVGPQRVAQIFGTSGFYAPSH